MSEIKLYIEATSSANNKRIYHINIDKPIINMDELVDIVHNDIFKDPTGIARKFLDFYGIGINLIRTKSREDAIRIKRQELCYFLFTFSLSDMHDIADMCGIHHATALHGAKTVINDMEHIKGYKEHINKIRGFIGLENIIRDMPQRNYYKKLYK
jgi:chromosomal replication initiation ATPase DnaA